MRNILLTLTLLMPALFACQKDIDEPKEIVHQIDDTTTCITLLPSDEELAKMEKVYLDYKAAKTASQTIYMPTVVHIMYVGSTGLGKMTPAAAINGFKAMRDRLRNDGDYFQPDGVDTQVELIPIELHYHDGEALFGETFKNGGYKYSGTEGVSNSQLNSLRALNPDCEHIFVFHKINSPGGNIAGLATLGMSWTNPTHVIRDIYWKGTTAVHEMGHRVNMFHTFQGASCAEESNCLVQGDRVCDTPPQLQTFSCTVCGFDNNNFMAYGSSCINRFTEGQKERAQSNLLFYKPQWIEGEPYDWSQFPMIMSVTRSNFTVPNNDFFVWEHTSQDSVRMLVSNDVSGQSITAYQFDIKARTSETLHPFRNLPNENHPAYLDGLNRYYAFQVKRNGVWKNYKYTWSFVNNQLTKYVNIDLSNKIITIIQ